MVCCVSHRHVCEKQPGRHIAVCVLGFGLADTSLYVYWASAWQTHRCMCIGLRPGRHVVVRVLGSGPADTLLYVYWASAWQTHRRNDNEDDDVQAGPSNSASIPDDDHQTERADPTNPVGIADENDQAGLSDPANPPLAPLEMHPRTAHDQERPY
ncbi:unnamed protein product [Danaus chrysippus]|uniref:(African queen) hypothetical protein n=1 Tax=Danaus chrysippus TaxID=151541 RepID=A0A8J2QUE6_9NEOP|nr:unnamed protein product [Danaus chrysippus]